MVAQWRPIIVEAAGEVAKSIVQELMAARMAPPQPAVRVNAQAEPAQEGCAYCSVAKSLLWAQTCLHRATMNERLKGTYTQLAQRSLTEALNTIRMLPSEWDRAAMQAGVYKLLGELTLFNPPEQLQAQAAECAGIIDIALNLAERGGSPPPGESNNGHGPADSSPDGGS